jgi:hypothetical protein
MSYQESRGRAGTPGSQGDADPNEWGLLRPEQSKKHTENASLLIIHYFPVSLCKLTRSVQFEHHEHDIPNQILNLFGHTGADGDEHVDSKGNILSS